MVLNSQLKASEGNGDGDCDESFDNDPHDGYNERAEGN